jgi:hypothetical protein
MIFTRCDTADGKTPSAIKLEKTSEKVVVSPPQLEQPDIKASGRRVLVNLMDSLKPNTTYTIDFSDAIVDNNEGNPLGNLCFFQFMFLLVQA